ncbi:peptidase S37, partial [Rhodobacteraceae bacterium PD-2]
MLLLVPASFAVCTSFAVAADSEPLSPRFDITRFEVRGNTLLPADALAQSVAPFVGAQRDFSDVAKAQEALEDVFHRQGYPLVRIDLPEQELNGGVVVLDVVQVRIGQVTVAG